MGAENLDFHPGLRMAYVEYCKLPVGQGRITFDPTSPKLSHSQFIKLLQDVGIAEPEGRVPLSTVSIIFTSYKPLGNSRMLFPQFFRALTALNQEAKQDVVQAVADFGSRSVDLQYLTSLQVFPNKAYPYILTKGGSEHAHAASVLSSSSTGPSTPISTDIAPDNDIAGATESRLGAHGRRIQSAAPAIMSSGGSGGLRATPIASYARGASSAKFANDSSTTASPRPTSVNRNPRGAWPVQPETSFLSESHIVSPQSIRARGGIPVTTTGSPLQVLVGQQHDTFSHSAHSSPHAVRSSPGIVPDSDDALFPANHHHLEQWGLWEPPKDGSIPTWLNYVLKRLDRLETKHESSNSQQTQQDINDTPKAGVQNVQDADVLDVKSEVAKLQQQLANTQAQVLELCARLSAVEKEKAESNEGGVTKADEAALVEVFKAVAASSEKTRVVAEEAIPSLEGALTELASQVLDLQGEVAKDRESLATLETTTSASLKRVLDEAVVDRTQLLTTTSLMDQAFTAVEQLKSQVDGMNINTSKETQETVPQGGSGHMQHLFDMLRKETGEQLSVSQRHLTQRIDQLAAEAPSPSVLEETHKSLAGRIDAVEQQLAACAQHAAVQLTTGEKVVQTLQEEVAAQHVALQSHIAETARAMEQLKHGNANVPDTPTQHGHNPLELDDIAARVSAIQQQLDQYITDQEEKLKAIQASHLSDGASEPAELSSLLQAVRQDMEQRISVLKANTADATAAHDGALESITQRVDGLHQEMSEQLQRVNIELEKAQQGHNIMAKVLSQIEGLKPDVDASQEEVKKVKEEIQQLRQELEVKLVSEGGQSPSDTTNVSEAKERLEQLAKRVETTDTNIKELGRAFALLNGQLEENRSSLVAAIRARRQSQAAPDSEQARRAAASAEDASAAAEAAFDLASALEDKMAVLDRLVRATTAEMQSLEATQKANIERISALEAQVQSVTHKQSETAGTSPEPAVESASAMMAASHVDNRIAAIESVISELQKGKVESKSGSQVLDKQEDAVRPPNTASITPDMWQQTQEKLQAVADALDNVKKSEEELQQSQAEVIGYKLKLSGLVETLNDHASRIESLQGTADNLALALSKVQGSNVSSAEKLLSLSKGVDDTVASQAELSALQEKVKNMENTLVNTLIRMDSSIAHTAARVMRGSLNGEALRAFDEDRTSSSMRSKGPLGSILAADGHVAGGVTSNSGVINPRRDALAAKVMDTDQKVATLETSLSEVKAGQDVLKQRLKELAEALISLSNKAQNRLTKLESMTRKSRESDETPTVPPQNGVNGVSGGVEESLTRVGSAKSGDGKPDGGFYKQPLVSPAHKQLDQNSGQVSGMNRILAKRLDELEERVAKAESKSKSAALRVDADLIAPENTTTATPPVAQPPAIEQEQLQLMEQDIKGLGQDIVALHSMLQRAEAELRQAITQECVSQADMQNFQQQLEATFTQKEEVILQLAKEIAAIKQK